MLDKFEIKLREFSSSHSGLFQDESTFNDIHYHHYLNCFTRIPEKWRSGFVKKFTNSATQKFQTLAEIEAISLFPERNLDIQPIGGGTPDFVIKLNREIIVDVYSSMNFLNSPIAKFEPGKAKGIGTVTKYLENVLEGKFKKYSGHPLVVFINKTFSTISWDQIHLLDLSRFEGHENLSGFVLYDSTQINKTVRFRFSVKKYEHAKFLLFEEEVKFLENAFLNYSYQLN